MILVIGGDHLGAILSNLENMGLGPVRHIKGRTEKRAEIPADVRLIVVLVDYVNHNLARWVKGQAKALGVPTVFSRRSWSAICQSMQGCAECAEAARCRQRMARDQAAG